MVFLTSLEFGIAGEAAAAAPPAEAAVSRSAISRRLSFGAAASRVGRVLSDPLRSADVLSSSEEVVASPPASASVAAAGGASSTPSFFRSLSSLEVELRPPATIYGMAARIHKT